MNDPTGFGLGARQIAISTAGWIPGIDRLAAEPLQVKLALSLHAPDDELRGRLMPVTKRFPIAEPDGGVQPLSRASHAAAVFVEYLLLEGVNDSRAHARALADLLRPHGRGAFHVNLIAYNPTAAGFKGSAQYVVEQFSKELERGNVGSSYRQSRGREIDAACGQLAMAGVPCGAVRPRRPDRVAANAAERERWNNERWAAIWPKRERLTDEVTAHLLDEAELAAGERVLDIGCGGGRAAIAAAGIVGEAGSVTGADLSRPLLALAEQRAQAAGAGNVGFQLLDVQTAPVAGAPFDVAISQFGVMFFDEPVRPSATSVPSSGRAVVSRSPAGSRAGRTPGCSRPRCARSSRRRPSRRRARPPPGRSRWPTPHTRPRSSSRPASATSGGHRSPSTWRLHSTRSTTTISWPSSGFPRSSGRTRTPPCSRSSSSSRSETGASAFRSPCRCSTPRTPERVPKRPRASPYATSSRPSAVRPSRPARSASATACSSAPSACSDA